MKQIIIFIVIIMAVTGFKPADPNPVIKPAQNKNIALSDWGYWNSMSCFPELKYRVRKANGSLNGKTGWEVQFRNDYDEDIHFNFTITEPGNRGAYINSDGSSKSLPYRNSLSPGRLTAENPFTMWINSSERCLVLVAQVHLGTDSGPYESCN